MRYRLHTSQLVTKSYADVFVSVFDSTALLSCLKLLCTHSFILELIIVGFRKFGPLDRQTDRLAGWLGGWLAG